MKQYLSILSVCYMTSTLGCGPSKGDNKRSNPVLPQEVSLAAPASHYFFADPTCQNQAPQLTVAGAQLFERDSGLQMSARTLNVTDLGIQSSPSLQSPAVAAVFAGGVFTRNCSNPLDHSLSCQDQSKREAGWKTTQKPQALKLCQTNTPYPRESFESIALQNVYYLEMTARQYRKLLPKFDPITLIVMPNYRSVYPQIENPNPKMVTPVTHVVHNLAYLPGAENIVIFPEPAERNEFFMEKGHLWESPFAAAHELGHHLEYQIRETDQTLFSLTWDPITHQYHAFSAEKNSAESLVAKTMGAYSEAFADLAAFYALNQDEHAITSILGFGESRSPLSDALKDADGNSLNKVLSEENLSRLYQVCTEQTTCDPSRQLGIHDVGAILVHALHAMFIHATSTGSPQDNDSSELLLQASTTWFRSMTRSLLTRSNDQLEQVLLFRDATPGIESAVLELLVKTQTSIPEQQAIKTDICRFSQRRLPVLQPAPFAGSC